jgi:hypothetical protein
MASEPRAESSLSTAVLPQLLTTAQVGKRYGCDVRAARRVMREAGVLHVAGRLLVPVDALAEWERRNLVRRVPVAPALLVPHRSRPRSLTDLPAGFWRAGEDDERRLP